MKVWEESKAFYAVYYLSHCLILLVITTILKKFFGRMRPKKPDYDNARNKRTFDLRSNETNNSFPSGDAAQAALFSFLVMSNFQ